MYPLSAAPAIKKNLLHEPPIGGTPIIDKEPIKKAKNIKGIDLP